MKIIKLSALLLGALLFTGCIETENKNHPPFEPTTIQTAEQKDALMKLAKKARANYEANKNKSTH